MKTSIQTDDKEDDSAEEDAHVDRLEASDSKAISLKRTAQEAHCQQLVQYTGPQKAMRMQAILSKNHQFREMW